jgi:zinc protease
MSLIRLSSAVRAALPALLLSLPATWAAEPPFEVHVLDNGLTVLLSPSDAHPVVSVACFVTTGGRTEDEYYQGSLHYIEHLVFKGGTPNLPPTQFRKKMSLLGREAGGWTWDDEINFGFEVPKENFTEAFGVFREALLDLQFEKQWFEDEKHVVLQEMTRDREEPDELVDEAWDETAYQVHPYRRSVIGTEKAVRDLDMDRTYHYYKERFTPNHMILSVSGDFDPADMLKQIDAQWGPLKKGPGSFELGLTEPEQKGPRARTDFLTQASTALLRIGVVTPGGSNEDTPALEMLAALMNDRSYGLPQYLVEQRKWVLSVEAEDYVKKDAADFRVSARTEPGNAEAVRAFVQGFLLDFDATSIPQEIFEQTRRRLLFEEASRRDTAAHRAGRYGFLVSRRGAEAALALEDRWAALTPEDVQAAKERWIGPRRLVTAIAFPDDWDPAGSSKERVEPRAPLARPVPDLEVAGALLPATEGALSYAKTAEQDGVSLYTFANGMRLLVRPAAKSPVVAVTGRILGGQWVEPDGKEGINRFVASLGMRHTRRFDREQFLRLMASRSIEASEDQYAGSRANTSRHVDYRDAAAHDYRGLREEWPTILACLKETLFFPDFGSDEVEKLRADLVNDARLLPEQNLEYIKQEFYDEAYRGHPYGHATFGTEESLGAITTDDLASFHRRNWTPDRAVIAVVGDVVPDEVATWISTRWGDLPHEARPPWTVDPSAFPLAWDPPHEQQVLELGKDYWTVNWGRPGASRLDDDFDTSVVLARVVGNDHFYKYVYGEGVSYRSWINFWPHLGPGAWILENDVKRDRFDEILAMFDEDLARYAAGGFTQQEFDDAVQRLVNGRILEQQDNALTAFRLAVAEGDGAGFAQETRAVDRFRAVKLEDAKQLAARIFDPEHILRMIQQ